jgi:hypothetical protein
MRNYYYNPIYFIKLLHFNNKILKIGIMKSIIVVFISYFNHIYYFNY